MALTQLLISSSKYGVKCPYTMTPKGICIHNTANDASARNEISYMQSNNNEVSFHIAVDDQEAIQGLPLDRNAWHAGDGGNGQGNRNYIAVEICYSKSGGSRFEAAEKRAAKEVAALLKKYGWGTDKIKDHRSFSGKNCPHRTNMSNFIKLVQSELTGSSATPPGATGKVTVGSKVKVVGTHYATGQEVPGWVKQNTYTVQQVNGDRALLQEITSWVYIKDLQLISGGAAATINVGSIVKVVGTHYATGQKVASFVYNNTYTVTQISGNRALLSDIISWVYLTDLKLV
ncbi:peptidoglycan recognition protein family protein [Clostridium perfringens]